jgi:putative inorganic carbon (HCO3(-)) transporter
LRDLAFLAAWAVFLPLALQGAQLGVLLWAWTSLLAPDDVLYGLGAAFPFAKIAAIVTLGLMLIGRGGGIRLRWDATALLLIGLALSGAVSQATGLAADTAAGWDLYQKFAKILLLALVVTAVMRDRLRLHALLLAICLGMGFTGLGEGAKFLLSGGGHQVLGTPSTGDNNQVGLDVLLIMPMLYYLHGTAKNRVLRLTCLAVGVMCAICIIATASRAAFIGLALLGVAFVLSSRRKVLGMLVVILVGLAGTQLVSDRWVERMDTIKTAEDDDSFLGRVGAWKISTAVALERPAFGGGFHAIQHPDVWAAHYAEASHMDSLISAIPTLTPKAAHSIYFEVLGDMGFVGLALFLALFATALRNAGMVRSLVRRSGRRDLDWAAGMAGALRISVLVFLIGGASLSAAYYDIDYLLVAMLAVLRDLVERALREQPAPVPVARAAATPVAVG